MGKPRTYRVRIHRGATLREALRRHCSVKTSGCHEWTGLKDVYGYGRLRFGGKIYKTHRLSWTLANGAIPNGLYVLHRCDNFACINPDHLFLGAAKDRTADMLAKGRHRYRAHRGRDNGRAKLTERRVLAIYRDERKYSDIAADHGVSKSTVFDIKSGDSWSHITAHPATTNEVSSNA